MKIKQGIPLIDQHDKNFLYGGKFGGNFIPETLKKPIDDLTKLFTKLRKDKNFLNMRDYYFNRIPDETSKKFNEEFDLDAETIKNNLYKQPNPNTYLATFAKFLINNKDSDYGKSLIKRGFNLFIERQILQFSDAKEIPIHFVGSISFYLKKELEQCLNAYGLKAGNVIRKPIDGLLQYHQKKLQHSYH